MFVCIIITLTCTHYYFEHEGALTLARVRVGKRGVIVIPKTVRDKLGIEEGMVLNLRIEDIRIIIETSDLWTELRKRGRQLRVKVDELMEELDEAEDEWSERLGK